ncbi:aldehyde dehydrogenase [Mariannaea sp. PMI_226]|nr:aldehyde dehydrogenase [Mariannaea sp. PMI_226]
MSAQAGRASGIDILSNFRNSINGKLTSTETLRHGVNPATGQANPPVPVSTQQDVDQAVDSGKEAFKTWSKTPFEERKKCLLAFVDAIIEHEEDLAKLLVMEQGKPKMRALGEVRDAVRWLQAFGALELGDEVIQEDNDTKVVRRHTPLGLSVGIVPWNYPLSLACGKLGPATLAGNPIIIKPSPFTPYTGLKLGEIAQKCFPPGVVQVLSGDDNLGPWLTSHPGPEKISFTGSTAVGKSIMKSAANTMKRLTLELGGNDPAIICKDVNIVETAQKVAHLCFLNSGQICLAIKRVYVHEDIHDEFRDAMVSYVQSLKVGEGNEEGVFMGPVQNKTQFDRVKGFLADIEEKKYNVAIGGNADDKPGFFVNPTIIDTPADDSRIVVEEPFGPVIPLLTWKDEADVLSRANGTRMGLGASVWSNDLDQASRMAGQLEAGSVWVNNHFALQPHIPYGGHKESGVGLELGMGGLLAFCNTQTVYLKK